MESICQLCQGLEYRIVDLHRVPCLCARLAKLKSYFPYLKYESVNKSIFDQAFKFSKLLKSGNLLVVADIPEDTLNLVILLHLISKGSPNYGILNSYELVEIFLEHHQEFKSVLDIQFDFLIVLHGYHEFENRRQEDFLLQLFDHYRRHQRDVMFISRVNIDGSSLLYKYIVDNKWSICDMNIKRVGSPYLK